MMSDCADGELRDLLPLYASARLAASERERVDAHIAGCAECAAELALLRSVAKAYDVTPIGIDAIAAALPRPGRAVRAKPHVPFHRQPLWRIAASITLVIASVAMVELVRLGGGPDGMVAGSSAGVDSSIGQPVESTLAMSNTGSAGVSDGPRATFGGGTLAELTDAQLEVLLASLEALDGNVLADPEIMATPLVPSPESESRRN